MLLFSLAQKKYVRISLTKIVTAKLDEDCSGNPYIVVKSMAVPEGQELPISTLPFEESTKNIQVDYKTVNQEAISPADYTATNGTLTIPAGLQFGTINVILVRDNVFEQSENFTVVMSKAKQAAISVGTGTVTIVDGGRQGSAPQESSTVVQSRSPRPRKQLTPNENFR